MAQSIKIALDAMGGDVGVAVIVPAALQALQRHPHLELVLVGAQESIERCLVAQGVALPFPRLSVVHASEVVGMDESPIHAVRRKKDSSMRVVIDLVHQDLVTACVSAGNTGALMAIAHLVLKTLPGVHRSAIISCFPTRQKKPVYLLDLGANVDCNAQHLYQFAVMGSVLVAALANIEAPRVGLLNVGVEEIKGNEQVKQAFRLLSGADTINFVGYAEGTDIFSGKVDVIVCDGFVGNIVLKSCEGLAKLSSKYIYDAFSATLWNKIVALLARPVLRQVAGRLDARQRNGANFLGLRGIVIKSHGSADITAFVSAIEMALRSAEKQLPTLIQHKVETALQGQDTS